MTEIVLRRRPEHWCPDPRCIFLGPRRLNVGWAEQRTLSGRLEGWVFSIRVLGLRVRLEIERAR